MKRILFLGLLIIVGTALVCSAIALYQWETEQDQTADTGCPPPRVLTPLPDIDALAKRIPFDQEIYRNVRDQALAAYAKAHPVAHPYDDQARQALRLIAYLCVWDDFYGEGLRDQLDAQADNLLREGNRDPIWQAFCDVDAMKTTFDYDNTPDYYNSRTDESATGFLDDIKIFGQTGYPSLFRCVAYDSAINNLLVGLHIADGGCPYGKHLLDQLPQLVQLETTYYGDLIKAGYSHHFLYEIGSELLNTARRDEPMLKEISLGLDRAFEAQDRDNPACDALDAQFYVDDAWYARGDGYADTVTQEGSQLMTDRLDTANKILLDLYAKYPNEEIIERVMMTVLLGTNADAETMEMWFDRGIKADPNDYKLYQSKRWYLMPRWYGSDDLVWQFGQECAQGGNWSAKIPMILIEGVKDAASRDPNLLAEPQIWEPLKKVYDDFLERFPNSTQYRSDLAIMAVKGGHWDVANEQFKILGDRWDRGIFDGEDYPGLKALAASHSGP